MIICARCGYENQLGHIFCTRCRARLDFNKLSEQELLKSKKFFGRKWLRIIMLVMGFLIAVAIVLAFWPLPIEAKRGTSVDLQQARRKIAIMEQGGVVSPQIFSESELNACLTATLEARRRSRALELRLVQVHVQPNAVVLSAVLLWKPLSAGGSQAGTIPSNLWHYRSSGDRKQGIQFFRFPEYDRPSALAGSLGAYAGSAD